MSEGGMHVVFGAGQVGLALASRLAGQGVSAWRAPVTVSGSAGTLIPAEPVEGAAAYVSPPATASG